MAPRRAILTVLLALHAAAPHAGEQLERAPVPRARTSTEPPARHYGGVKAAVQHKCVQPNLHWHARAA